MRNERMDQIDSTQSQVKSNYPILFLPIIASFVVVVVHFVFQTWVEHLHRWLISPHPFGAMKLGMSGVGLLAALSLAAVILNQHDEVFGLSAEIGIYLSALCAMTVVSIIAPHLIIYCALLLFIVIALCHQSRLVKK